MLTSHPSFLRLAIAFLVASALSTLAPGAAGAVVAVAAADPLVAPVTTLSTDGRSATDGRRTLTVSQAVGLDPAGQTIQVSGAGYDTNKGIYIALCVIPPRNVLPTPCGGGVDVEGQAGASQWISSNPPAYGVGLALPWGAGGSFSVSFGVSATINPTVDCRMVRCAVVTRSDHTRTSDRSQDMFIPVAFAQPAAPAPGALATGAPTPAPPTPSPAAAANPTPPAGVGGAVTTPGAVPGVTAAPVETTTTLATTTTTTTTAPATTTTAPSDDASGVKEGTRSPGASGSAESDGEAASATVRDDESGGSGAAVALAGGTAACAVAVGSVIWWRRRRIGAEGDPA